MKMPLYSLDSLFAELEVRGYEIMESNDPSCCIYRSPHSTWYVVVPMGEGDTLPDLIIRHLMSHEPINIDKFMDSLAQREQS